MATQKILLIDYEPRSIERARKALTAAGFTVEVATDGVSGIERFQAARPELVLIEAMVPKKHGFDTCLHLKRTPEGMRTPIVIMSGVYRGESHRNRALKLYGCDDFVEKPIDAVRLVELCRRFVPRPIEEETLPVAVPAPVGSVAAVGAAPDAPAPSGDDPMEQEILSRLDVLLAGEPGAASSPHPAQEDAPTPGGIGEAIAEAPVELPAADSNLAETPWGDDFVVAGEEPEAQAPGKADDVEISTAVAEHGEARDGDAIAAIDDIDDELREEIVTVEEAPPDVEAAEFPERPQVEERAAERPEEAPRLSRKPFDTAKRVRSAGTRWLWAAAAVVLLGIIWLFSRGSFGPSGSGTEAPVRDVATTESHPITRVGAASERRPQAARHEPVAVRESTPPATPAGPRAPQVVNPEPIARTGSGPKPVESRAARGREAKPAPGPATVSLTAPAEAPRAVEPASTQQTATVVTAIEPATRPAPAPEPSVAQTLPSREAIPQAETVTREAKIPDEPASAPAKADAGSDLPLFQDEVDQPPRLLSQPSPERPLSLAPGSARGGTVRLRVLVNEVGKVTSVQIVKGTSLADLDLAAKTAVQRSAYAPAVNKGVPVKCWVDATITFAP